MRRFKELSSDVQFVTVSDRQAKALERPTSRHILLALAKNDATASELAAALGLSLGLLHYHIARLQELKLVKVAHELRRAGRSIKTYRSIARAFFVPYGEAARSASRGLLAELHEALDREQLKQRSIGTLYSVDGNGRPKMQRIQSGASASFETWYRLSLDTHAAERLAQELRLVLSRHASAQTTKGGKRFLIYCGMANSRGAG